MSKEEISKNINQNDGSQDNRIIIFCVCYFTLGKKKPFLFNFMCRGCFVCMHACVSPVCQLPKEVRKGYQSP